VQLEINSHIAPGHLLQICRRIISLLNHEVKASVEGVLSVLGAGRQSVLRTELGATYIISKVFLAGTLIYTWWFQKLECFYKSFLLCDCM